MSRVRRWFDALRPSIRCIRCVRWLATGLGLAGWLYAAQIGSWTSERNRYHDFWSRLDAWAIVIGVLGLSVLVAIAGYGLSRVRNPWGKSAARFAFSLILADLALSWLTSTFVGVGFTAKYDAVFWLGWVSLATVLFFVRHPAWRISSALARLMWPLPIIYGFLVFSWPSWDGRGGDSSAIHEIPQETSRQDATAAPVYIFIFDEWSYPRSLEKGRFCADLPHLAAFGEHATVFHQAFSPADTTYVSLPRLLLQQRDGSLALSGGRAFWQTDQERRPLGELPTILDAAVKLGYHARLLGFYHPYHSLFQEHAFEARGYPNDPKRADLAGRTLELLVYNLDFLTDPLSRWIYRWYQSRHFSEHWRRHVTNIVAESLELLDRGEQNLFAVFHWPLPHGPFIFDKQGYYLGPYDPLRDTMYGTPEDYHRHLQLLDRRIGKIVQHLRATGRYDEALIVFTSDHSWRRDPLLTTKPNAPQRRHVPLLIKFPGQTEGQEVWDPVELADLQGLILPRLAGLRSSR